MEHKMKLNELYYCPECNEVFERNSLGLFSQDCPSCTNHFTVLLSIFFKKDMSKGETSGFAQIFDKGGTGF